jgi:rubrerythrin
MAKGNPQLAEVILRAIQTEADGYQFYSLAARNVSDPKGKDVFETLAQEELGHGRFLQAQREALQKTGQVDESIKLGPRAPLEGPNPIFSNDIKGRLKTAQFEMSALSIGLQLELSSEENYRKQAERVSDPKVRAFFLELAAWESGHYQALLKQQETLKDDFWAQGGFAPF